MADTYSAAEAGTLLGVSERRVRQLAAAGHLVIEQAKPLRLSARSVIDERKRRERSPRPEPSGSATGLDPAQLRELVSAIVSDLLPLALEGRDRAEQLLRDELAQSRAEAAQLRAQLDEAQAAKKAKTSQKAKKAKGSKKGKGSKKAKGSKKGRRKLLGLI